MAQEREGGKRGERGEREQEEKGEREEERGSHRKTFFCEWKKRFYGIFRAFQKKLMNDRSCA